MTEDDADKLSKQDSRFPLILQLLRKTGEISVESLSHSLDVSVHTIRRDLQQMESRGLLRRKHGGAAALGPLLYEPFKADKSFQEMVGRFADEKRRIGRAAAESIEDGEVIALTAGTTATEVIRNLPLNRHIVVVTNTVNVAMELANRKDVDVYVTGGHLRGEWFSLVGMTAIESMRKIVVDRLFIGVNGIDAMRGLTCYNAEEAEINRAMVGQAKRKIVIADHSKFGVAARWKICETRDVDLIITDADTPRTEMKKFSKAGIKVIGV